MPDRPVVTPITPELLHGALGVERTPTGTRVRRLPARALQQAADPQLALAESQPSGVRIAAVTAATTLELTALATRYGLRGAPPRSPGVFDLVVDGRLTAQASLPTAVAVVVDPATGARETVAAPPSRVVFDDLPAGEKSVEIWLPHNEAVELVELRGDAPLRQQPARGPVWCHYGSSISHGSNATHPTGTWPAVAATLAGLDLVCLGFGGSALLDPFVARTLRDAPADLISLKIGINLVNSDVMRLRAFRTAVHGFLDTIRDGHPTTPLLVISPINCPIHEDTPGPGALDPAALAEGRVRFVATGDPAERAAGKLTLRTVRAELARIVAERATDDPHLSYLDGLALYGEADAAEHPLPDALHPDGPTHRLIGERFAAYLRGES